MRRTYFVFLISTIVSLVVATAILFVPGLDEFLDSVISRNISINIWVSAIFFFGSSILLFYFHLPIPSKLVWTAFIFVIVTVAGSKLGSIFGPFNLHYFYMKGGVIDLRFQDIPKNNDDSLVLAGFILLPLLLIMYKYTFEEDVNKSRLK